MAPSLFWALEIDGRVKSFADQAIVSRFQSKPVRAGNSGSREKIVE